jgi:RNA polymerase sigma factor (sigma-70 family)
MQEDVLLVQQALSGDKLAFCRLIQKYYKSIYAQILSLVHNHEDTEELTDDVFIKAYVSLSALKQPANFFMWLRQIAWNHSRNWLRQRENNCLPLDDVYDETEANLICDSAEDRLIHQEKLDKILEAIKALPEMDKSLMQDFYLEETPYETLQERYKITKPAINARLIRARKRIREQLRDLFSGIVIFSWHDTLRKMLSGGVEAVKISVKTKLIITGIAIIVVSGGTAMFIWHSHQSTMESPKVSVSQSAQNMLQQSSAKPIVAKNTKVIVADKPTNQEMEKAKEDETSKPIIDEHTDQAVKASVTSSDNLVEKAEQTVKDFLSACTAGDLQLYTSYFRGKAKALNAKLLEDWLASGNSLEGWRNTLTNDMSKLKIVNTKCITPDRAIVELIIGARYNENPRTGGTLYEYKTGDNYDIVIHYFYYVDRYNDGWYISDISAKADETEKEK